MTDTPSQISPQNVQFSEVKTAGAAFKASFDHAIGFAWKLTGGCIAAHYRDGDLLATSTRSTDGGQFRDGMQEDIQTMVLDGKTHAICNREARQENWTKAWSFLGKAFELAFSCTEKGK